MLLNSSVYSAIVLPEMRYPLILSELHLYPHGESNPGLVRERDLS